MSASRRIILSLEEGALADPERLRAELRKAGVANLSSLHRKAEWTQGPDSRPASAETSELSVDMAGDWSGDDIERLRQIPGVRDVSWSDWKHA